MLFHLTLLRLAPDNEDLCDDALGLPHGRPKTNEIVSILSNFPVVPINEFLWMTRCPLLQLMGQPEDVATVVAYLALKEAHCIIGGPRKLEYLQP